MRIELKKADLLVIGSLAGLAYLAYKAMKSNAEIKKKFDAHKEECLKGRDIDTEIKEASLENVKLSTEDKAEAKRILTHMKKHILNASSIDVFDIQLATYDTIRDVFLHAPAEQASAEIMYEKCKIDEELRIAELEHKLESERRNSKDISDAIRSINRSYYTKNDKLLSVTIE